MALVTLSPINGKLKNGVVASGIIPVTGDLGAGADTTVFTPVNPNNFVALVGITFAKTLTAYTFAFKSNGTLLTLDMPANSGLTSALGNGVYIVGQKGQPLVVNCSIALASVLFYVVEAESIGI